MEKSSKIFYVTVMHYPHFTPPPPLKGLIGHRGISALAPENTLSSFKLAAQQGINWIEFDLRLTKDDYLVVFHDDILDRTSNGKGWVHHHTLEEIQMLDAGSWFHSSFKEEKIPSFKEILPILIDLPLFLNIELKLPRDPKCFAQRLSHQFIKILQEQWPAHLPLPLVSSFHWPLLERIRSSFPTIPLGFLVEACSKSKLLKVASIPNAALHCNHQSLTDEMLSFAQKLEIPLLAYTVNQPAIAKRLFLAGIFGLFSDNPHHLLRTER